MFTQQLFKVLGAAIKAPNQILSPAGADFYVSYNDVDTDIYGSVTTALVVGQMERFYVLNGDHRAQYQAIAEFGLQACLDYFSQNQTQMNAKSDCLPQVIH